MSVMREQMPLIVMCTSSRCIDLQSGVRLFNLSIDKRKLYLLNELHWLHYSQYIVGQQSITITWNIEWIDGATLPPSTAAPTSPVIKSEFPDWAIAVIVVVVVVIIVIVVVVVCCCNKRASK